MLFSKKDLYKLMWPLIVEQSLNVLVGMVDVVMVAAVGEAAVSGVSLVDSINILVIQVLTALATGGAIVCAQYIGARDMQNARRSAGQLILVTVAGAFAVALACLMGGRSFLQLIFGAVSQDVMDDAWLYFKITAISYPFLAMYNSSASLFRAMGNSKIAMKASMVMNGINVVGNAFCIYILKMGVAGVALPTLFARAFAAVMITIMLHNPGNEVRIGSLKDLLPDVRLIHRILAVGIPNGLENGMFQFGKLLLQSLISTLGTASIAGYAVAFNLVTFLYLPGNALANGMITVVGQCVGAGEYEQAKTYSKWIIWANYALLAVIATGMALGRHFLVGLYNLSPEAAAIGAYMVLIHCIAMIIWPPSFTLPSALRAGNDVKFTMITSVLIMWVFRVAGAYLLVRGLGFGVEGVWYAMFIDWSVRFILYPWRFRTFEERCLQKA